MTLGRSGSMRSGQALGRSSSMGASASLAAPSPPNMTGLEVYQRQGVRWLRQRSHALLADAMGLGKTAQFLRALRGRERVVVVCPKSVKLTWRDEAARWRSDIRVVYGELRRPGRGEILVVSADALPEPTPGARVLIREPMGDVTLGVDECHMFKSEDAERTRRLRLLAGQCGRVWGLTGTPLLSSPEDLWGVLVSLRIGVELFACDCEPDPITGEGCGSARAHFRTLCGGKERWVWNPLTKQRHRRGWTWGEVSPVVAERLRAGPMLRRDASLLNLPPVREQTLLVEAPEDLRSFLDGVREKWDEVDPATMPPFEMISEARAALARSRAEMAAEWADSRARLEDPMLVFSDHAGPVAECGKLRGAETITGATSSRERSRIVSAFQLGRVRLLAMTVDAGGVGLNLQRAASVLHVDLPWTPALIDQANARAARKGQTRSVLVTYMVSDHPLDVRLQAILQEKRRLAREALGDA